MANDVWNIQSDLEISYYKGGVWNAIQTDSYSLNIDRGILIEQSVFARPDIGTLEVQLVKKDLSDLVNGPDYKPDNPIRVRYRPNPNTAPSTWYPIYNGYIQNVGMSYNVDAKKLGITITANDGIKILTNTRIGTFNITGGIASRGFRTVMNQLASAVSAIDSRVNLSQLGGGGSSSYQRALTYLNYQSGDLFNQFLDAELGWLFHSRGGLSYYLTRSDIDSKQSVAWSSLNPTVSNVHSTSTSHYCMNDIDLSFDTDVLVNDVKVIETNSTPASDVTAVNSTSKTNYGSHSENFEVNMEPGSSPSWTYMNDWATAVANAADPKQIRRVSCPAVRRDGIVANIVLIEIADNLQVEFVDPNNTSNKIQQVQLVTRIRHSISPDHWEISLDLWKGI